MNAERPLLDVFREVERPGYCGSNAAIRLAKELRAIAPLLREAALKIYVNRHPGPVPDLVRTLRAKADELEAC